MRPTLIVVGTDRPAYVLLVGHDVDSPTQGGCGRAAYLRYEFDLPKHAGTLSARVPAGRRGDYVMFGPLGVTPFVPAADVIATQR